MCNSKLVVCPCYEPCGVLKMLALGSHKRRFYYLHFTSSCLGQVEEAIYGACLLGITIFFECVIIWKKDINFCLCVHMHADITVQTDIHPVS